MAKSVGDREGAKRPPVELGDAEIGKVRGGVTKGFIGMESEGFIGLEQDGFKAGTDLSQK